ncbi:hypothetical protein [Variovorax sp. HJSM1_2]|uniref:hypothetical protein n=1 Tax=Variovorax sp. HJSM1_2 TaxID=3366263 RepID=UPI003BE2B507
MSARLNATWTGASAGPPCVLTVFVQREPRDLVHEVCSALQPGARVIDAASATDAVMTLLAKDIDLVLVDLDGAGELLGALRRHVQRSAPDATLLGFGRMLPPAAAQPVHEGASSVHSWAELEYTLTAWLQQWPRPKAIEG